MAEKHIAAKIKSYFSAAANRQNLTSGEEIQTSFGKIAKWLSDLKTVAFTGSYNDLDNKPSIPSAVAVKGNAETNYRTGNVNLTPANIGAATTAQGTKADSAVQTIQMNGSTVTKTSGAVNLGTVITAHQDISGKADKSATVSTVTYDTTNKKLTKTINGTTSDVVTTAQLKTDMALSKSDVGLGNVGNFKAVSTAASQGLTDTEKANARTNIGAGTSSFSGSYNDLSNKPTIPTKVSQLTNDSGYTTNTGTVTQVKVGSTAYNPSSGVISLPAYPTDTNTHRPIQLNGTEILGNNTTALNLKAGSNVNISNSNGTVTINATDTNTTYSAGTGTTITGTNNAINVSYGTTANTACQGNDSRLSNSRPASDVYSWAKAASKPTYTASEVGAAPASHTQASNTINAMTGYTKPSSTSAITASDTLNQAIGKLEKGLDGAGTPNDGVLTIQQNGTTLGTFSANQAGNTTIVIQQEEATFTLGLRADFVNSTFTRLGDAVGLSSGAYFDTFPMYRRRRCNLADDGTVNAYLGDANYAVDGSNGQVMVEQPKFYYKVVPVTTNVSELQVAEYWVSNKPLAGYRLHPAFKNTSGNEIDYFYESAYEGYVDNNKLSSISGVTPIGAQSRATFRTQAANRGAGWTQETIWSLSADQLLMIIEYGKFNMQSAIGSGYTGASSSQTYLTTGTLNSYGNGTYGGKNTTAVQWRGKENPWGNRLTYVDGINILNDYDPYIANSYNFVDDTSTNYTYVKYHTAKSSNYIKYFGYHVNTDWIFIPNVYRNGADSSTPIGDYYDGSSSGTVWCTGGGKGDSTQAGLFCYSRTSSSASMYSEYIGARLLYVG